MLDPKPTVLRLAVFNDPPCQKQPEFTDLGLRWFKYGLIANPILMTPIWGIPLTMLPADQFRPCIPFLIAYTILANACPGGGLAINNLARHLGWHSRWIDGILFVAGLVSLLFLGFLFLFYGLGLAFIPESH